MNIKNLPKHNFLCIFVKGGQRLLRKPETKGSLIFKACQAELIGLGRNVNWCLLDLLILFEILSLEIKSKVLYHIPLST